LKLTTLVIGGTGTVGSQVVAGLLRRGDGVRCLVRSAEKAGRLPRGVEPVVGDLEKPETLRPAFEGTEAVFLLNALSRNETEQGLAAVEAARSAGVRRLVYMSVVMPRGSEHIPHFRSKIPVEQAIRDSGTPYTILRPNSFFQNDLMFKEAIALYGVYPQPIGSKGMHRVDVRDIADIGVAALGAAGHEGREYTIHGPEAETGEGVAAAWGRHLGREVRYGGDDLDAWEQNARRLLPEWMAHNLRIMYQHLQEHGLKPSGEEIETQRRVLGREPRSFDLFAAEVARDWKEQ
jgi:uncharacterized protein YbjT (DUF2867 family)